VDALHQFGHLPEHPVHLGHHVDAVDPHLLADRPAQRGMQCRAALRGIHCAAFEQRLDGLAQSGLFGQLEQGGQAGVVDQVLRVVEEQSGLVQRVAGEALRIAGEGLAQTEVGEACALCAQRLPGRQLGGILGLEVVRHRRVRCLSGDG